MKLDYSKLCIGTLSLFVGLGGACAVDDSSVGATASSGEGSPVCVENTDLATDFVETNRACETVLDCQLENAFCYDGAVSRACGTVALAVGADLGRWNELHAEIEASCDCGGVDPCGADAMCNDQGACVSTFGDPNYCASIERDIQTFLASNRECETAADCVEGDSTCYGGDGSACVIVGLNTDANLDDWNRLHELLESRCVDRCNADGDCGAIVACSPQGQCVAQF